MAHPLKISLVQTSIEWGDKAYNLNHFQSLLERTAGKTDLAVLPETFSTGFSINADSMAEDTDGETMSRLMEWASKYNMAITGSIIARTDNRCYNRGFLVTPQGNAYSYDKRHLFAIAGENQHFTPGNRQMIVQYKGWNICLQICYDLRFPVWSRNVNNAYDLLIYVANWPAPRHSAWTALLPARAIENQAYVCGVNCLGIDAGGTHYLGGSALYSPKGKQAADCAQKTDFVCTLVIDKDELDAYRSKFPAWQDADRFALTP